MERLHMSLPHPNTHWQQIGNEMDCSFPLLIILRLLCRFHVRWPLIDFLFELLAALASVGA